MKTYTVTGVRKVKDQLAWRVDVVDVTTGVKAQVLMNHKDALEIGIAIATSLYSRESRARSKKVRDDGNLLNTMMSGVVPKAFENWLRLEGEGEVGEHLHIDRPCCDPNPKLFSGLLFKPTIEGEVE